MNGWGGAREGLSLFFSYNDGSTVGLMTNGTPVKYALSYRCLYFNLIRLSFVLGCNRASMNS